MCVSTSSVKLARKEFVQSSLPYPCSCSMAQAWGWIAASRPAQEEAMGQVVVSHCAAHAMALNFCCGSLRDEIKFGLLYFCFLRIKDSFYLS